MTALTLVLGALAVQYIVYVLVDSTVFEPVRSRLLSVPVARDVVRCGSCASFWAALLVFLIALVPYGSWVLWPLAFAGGGQILYWLRSLIEEHS